jgi:nucleoside triphosphate diphosphatase
MHKEIAKLLEIMAALRTPGTGCPWDLEQSLATIAPYTIEEAYEVADAIARGNFDDLREELGDLLLQVVFHARLAEEIGAFDFGDVVDAITDKLIRRHPHVFGAQSGLSSDEVKALWAKIKADEKAARNAANGPDRSAELLSDIPIGLPGLTRAVKLQTKAASLGFDWNDAQLVLDKIREETDEFEAALESKDAAAMEDEIGDLLFALANLARHVGVDPEAAIRRTHLKFMRRFGHIERELARRCGAPASLAEMDALWNEAKELEK